MRPYYLTLALALLLTLANGTPIFRRKIPVENSPLAHLEGLSGCYVCVVSSVIFGLVTCINTNAWQVRCMITEAYLWKYDMFTWSLQDWCADHYGRLGYTRIWITLHFKECVNQSCPDSKFDQNGEFLLR